ncbi:spore cortex-lytic enzyme [Brevibacillus fluminis]|uniref:Spore cortex-lytic enzyme n=1 Tax=Brevibacillus fluminis TaxID=511487 RepID=A0A3M8DV70_9BACL|nr:spore cortex-lytic enzyme [Brevibacillus fluminis]RNB91972.1 spore cortex-lytic enzyme [Brevibacillus fluminis]
MKRFHKWALSFLVLCSTTLAAHSPVEAATVLQVGSQTGDVWDLQYRLQSIGYDVGKLDGIYGSQTRQAVIRFQEDYGLNVDGIAGSTTIGILKKYSVNATEMDLLARLVYSEARGESYTGQVAVAAVVMNRLQSSEFPKTIRDVIFQAGAFTATDDGQFWLTPDSTAYLAAQDAVRGWDPSGNALYYFNPITATSKWIWTRPQIKQIGHHIFTK